MNSQEIKIFNLVKQVLENNDFSYSHNIDGFVHTWYKNDIRACFEDSELYYYFEDKCFLKIDSMSLKSDVDILEKSIRSIEIWSGRFGGVVCMTNSYSNFTKYKHYRLYSVYPRGFELIDDMNGHYTITYENFDNFVPIDEYRLDKIEQICS